MRSDRFIPPRHLALRAALLIAGSVGGLLAGCGGDSTGPGPTPPTYENISGTYAGVVAGIAQGVQLNATFSLTISQSGGTLSGSWSLAGNLTDGVVVLPVGGSGTITGTIAPGTNPSINVTIRTPQCPNVQENFSGSLDSANDIITLSGPIHWFDDDCTILLSWPTVVILSR